MNYFQLYFVHFLGQFRRVLKRIYLTVSAGPSDFLFLAVASEAICKWGGRMPARSAGRNFFDVPPHFSLVPPHEGAQRLFVTD